MLKPVATPPRDLKPNSCFLFLLKSNRDAAIKQASICSAMLRGCWHVLEPFLIQTAGYTHTKSLYYLRITQQQYWDTPTVAIRSDFGGNTRLGLSWSRFSPSLLTLNQQNIQGFYSMWKDENSRVPALGGWKVLWSLFTLSELMPLVLLISLLPSAVLYCLWNNTEADFPRSPIKKRIFTPFEIRA